MKKYVLKMNEEQAKICATACEFYARIMMGQFQEIPYHLMQEQIADEGYLYRRELAENCLMAAKKAIYPEIGGIGASYGMGKFPKADASFDIYQVLREKFPHDGRTPFSYGELPECEVVEE